MNGKDSDLTMEMLARGLTRAASGAAKDIDAEQNASILGSFSSFWGSDRSGCADNLKRRIGINLLLNLLLLMWNIVMVLSAHPDMVL